jgi:DNA primase
MIPNKTIEEIFQKARIEEVVGDFLVLKKRGVNLLGHCPFHNEKTPSFTVSPTKNIFKCFGCGKSGTSVGFIMEHENMSYVEALHYLARKYNVLIEEVEKKPEQIEEDRQKESLILINEFAMKHFQYNLMETQFGRDAGLSYFTSRGFHQGTIDKFGLGFAFPDGHNLQNEAKVKVYNIDLMKQLGLITEHNRDFFTNRVMFPIFNLSGRIVGFGGRALTTNDKTPKYLNSSESIIYNKSNILYGFFQGKNAIRKEDHCLLVEGYIDVTTLHQAGIEIAVASSGTSLTLEQALLIKRFTDNVTILYDGDQAGIKASLRALDILLEQNLNVKIAVLPNEEDPDSYLKAHGSQALTDYLATNSMDFVQFKLSIISDVEKNDPIKKVTIAQDMIQSIARIPDMLKRDIFAAETSKVLDIREEVIFAELAKALKKHADQQRLEEIRDQRLKDRDQSNNAPPHVENLLEKSDQNMPLEAILKILLLHGDKEYDDESNKLIKEIIIQDLEDEISCFDQSLYLSLFNEYKERLDAGISNSFEYYINHPNQEIRKMALSWIDSGYEFSHNWIDKYNHHLQYQKAIEENYINEYQQSLLLVKMQTLNITAEANKQIINEMISNKDEEGLTKLLYIQIGINKKRMELAQQLGMVIIPK